MPVKSDKNILSRVLHAYQGGAATSLYSSDWWLAERAGEEMRKAGYSTPTAARIGKGYSVRLETSSNEFTVSFTGNELKRVAITRH